MKKNTKRSLFFSVMALILCCALLAGTTLAWFTDTATTAVNKIQAGTLDVALEMATAWDESGNVTNWESAEGKTLQFKKADGSTEVLWEPGCTYELPELQIVNKGDLHLKYKIVLSGIDGAAKLNEVIDWTMTAGTVNYDLHGGTELNLAPGAESGAITISGHMKEEAGNEYQGLSIDGVAITVYATQKTAEFDSIGNQYDAGATYPMNIVPAVQNQELTAVKDENDHVTGYQYSNSDNTFSAKLPAAAVTSQEQPTVTIKKTDLPANITVDAADQDSISYDIKIENAGISASNLATLTLDIGKGLNDVTLYHGNVAMTSKGSVEQLTSTDTFYYDRNTGKVTFAVSHFSVFTVITDAPVAVSAGVRYYDLQSALDTSNSEVVLLRDVKKDITIPEDKNVILNLNSKTVTNNAGDTITVPLSSTLTINGNGTVDNVTHARAAIVNNGTVTLNGGAYTRSKEASSSTTSSGGNSYYNILNHGQMTINSGVSVTSTGSFSSLIDNGYFNYADNKNPRSGYVAGTNQETPSLTINGGTFSGGINTVKNDDNAKLTINGGTFGNVTQAVVQNNNVATITGGTFNAANCNALENKKYPGSYNKGELNISGGTFSGNLYTYGDATWNITGGTFETNVSTDAQLEAALKGTGEKIIVNLLDDVTYNITPWNNGIGTMGGDNTQEIVINGNGNKLTFNNTNSDWNAIYIKNEGATLTINNAKLTNSGNNDSAWNRHDVNFACKVVLNNVVSDKAIAVAKDSTLNKCTISDNRASDDYLLWIQACGETVTVKDCEFLNTKTSNTTRGIAIKNQYIDSPEMVTLNVSGTSFVTTKKAAVLVASPAGANIVWGTGNDISGVTDDTVNAVWNDADYTDAFDQVTVTGCTKLQEK